jgi:hypothetical protein
VPIAGEAGGEGAERLPEGTLLMRISLVTACRACRMQYDA